MFMPIYPNFGGNNLSISARTADVMWIVDNTPPARTKLRRCIIEELLNDANVTVDAREELAKKLQDCSGDSDDGYDEFVMYMPDIDMPEFDMEDVDGGSDEDTDSSVQIIETLDDSESENEGLTDKAHLHPNTQTNAQNSFETPSKPEKVQSSKTSAQTRSQRQGKTGQLNPCTSPKT
uniref:Uncharacterized protein n=1 Tax=Cannabis sativa TaxID=3483 RepID=A0A803PQ99_CANSA